VSAASLKRIGIDRLSNDTGVLSVMDNAGITQRPSDIAGKIFFWLVLFMFMVPAADTLNFSDFVILIKSIISYIPKLIIAIVILIFGTMFAKFIRDTIIDNRIFSNVNASGSIGNAVYFVVVATIVLMALEQLAINTKFLYSIMLLMIAGVVLALAIAMGLGAKDIAKKLMIGSYARETFTPGSVLEVNQYKGEVQEVSTLSTIIKSAENGDMISIPNDELYQHWVKIKQR
jgi:small-conductance mechanosensitive channel